MEAESNIEVLKSYEPQFPEPDVPVGYQRVMNWWKTWRDHPMRSNPEMLDRAIEDLAALVDDGWENWEEDPVIVVARSEIPQGPPVLSR